MHCTHTQTCDINSEALIASIGLLIDQQVIFLMISDEKVTCINKIKRQFLIMNNSSDFNKILRNLNGNHPLSCIIMFS